MHFVMLISKVFRWRRRFPFPLLWPHFSSRLGLPHEYETWFGPGHRIPNGDPPEPFSDNTGMCCWMLLSLPFFPDEFARCGSMPKRRSTSWRCCHSMKSIGVYKNRRSSIDNYRCLVNGFYIFPNIKNIFGIRCFDLINNNNICHS